MWPTYDHSEIMNVAVMYDKFGKSAASGARISIHTLLAGLPASAQVTVFDGCHDNTTIPDFINHRYTFATQSLS